MLPTQIPSLDPTHQAIVLVISTLVGGWLQMPVAANCVFELATAGVMPTDWSERLSPQANRAVVIVIRKQRCEAGGSFVMNPLPGGIYGAGDGGRTRDIDLGKVALYH